MRQEVEHLIHQVDTHIFVLDADVHMHPADQETPNDTLERIGECVVLGLVGVELLAPGCERMRRSRDDRQSVFGHDVRNIGAELRKVRPHFLHGAAHRSTDFDLRPDELRAHHPLGDLLTRGEQAVRHIADEIASLSIDDEVLLLDPNGVARFSRHGSSSPRSVESISHAPNP